MTSIFEGTQLDPPKQGQKTPNPKQGAKEPHLGSR